MKLNQIYFGIIMIIISVTSLSAQKIIKFSGRVVDEQGIPLPSVNIIILQTTEGTASDADGHFLLTTTRRDRITLKATMIGFAEYQETFKISQNVRTEDLEIIMRVESIEFNEAVVLGSSFSSEKGKGIVVSSVDVRTTPGGAADLFQSLKTMPGITQVSESAELYVRGGDPTETITMIDQASIYHPYTYESSYGGLFSNLNTNAVSEMYFSSGGFSAKYGNVLSGVLDIQTKDLPSEPGFSAGISMAAAALDGEIPIVDNKLGLRFYSQQSYTKPIMWMNGGLDDFTAAPTSGNFTTSLIYKFSQTGRLKATYIIAQDKQGVNVKRAEYDGVFNGNSTTNFLNLQLSELIGVNTLLKSSLSYSSFDNKWKFGVLDLDKVDRALKSRTDIEHTFSEKIQLLTGIEFENRQESYIGVIPKEDHNIRPDASNELLNEKIEENRIGAYAEIKKLDLWGVEKLFIMTGIRTDHFTKLNLTNLDIRFGLGYQLSETSKIRFAFGTFHQVPDFRLYAEQDGNPNLESMRALHYVLSYDYEIDNTNSLRAELYHKNYDNLPLENDIINYSNDGHGYATGLDLIFKGQFPLGINGWISYGFIDTKRKWMEYEELTNSNFDITHNLTMVLKYSISPMWQLGINFKYATGKPYSPVIGSIFHEETNIYEPVYAKDNSARYPDYKRLDLRVTHLNQFFGNLSAIFYVEALNILDIENLFDYTYNADYTEQEMIRSYFGRRTIVIGTVITF